MAPLALAWPGAVAGQTVPVAPTVAGKPAVEAAALDKELTRELARGVLFDALASKGKFPKKPFAPPEDLLKPYAEAAVGPAVAFEMVRGADFVSAPEAQAMAQRIVNRLLLSIPAQSRPALRVHIVAKPDYGARASESGIILLSLGTFGSTDTGVRTEEELALLLGHEVAHYVLGHVSGGGLPQIAGTVVRSLSTGLVYYSALKGSRFVDGKLTGEGDKKLMLRTLIGGMTSSTVIEDLLTPSYKRETEMEADRLGIDLVKRANYALSPGDVAKFVGSHGESALQYSQRLMALQAVVTTLLATAAPVVSKKVGDNSNTTGMLLAVFGKELTGGLASLIVKATASHPRIEERIAFTTSYFNANYPNAMVDAQGNRLQRTVGTVGAVTAAPAMLTLFSDIRQAWTFRGQADKLVESARGAAAGDQQDMNYEALFKQAGFRMARQTQPEAAPPARPKRPVNTKRKAPSPVAATAAPPRRGFGNDAAALTHLTEGIIQIGNGDRSGAQGSWRRGLRSDYASVTMARVFSDSLPGDETSAAEYDALIARSKRLFGTSDPVLDIVVASAMVRGDAAGAEVAAARCVNYEDGAIYGSCAARLGYNPLAQNETAKTPEGERAFGRAKLKRSTKLLGKVGVLFK